MVLGPLSSISLISGVLSAGSGCCSVHEDLIQVKNSKRTKLFKLDFEKRHDCKGNDTLCHHPNSLKKQARKSGRRCARNDLDKRKTSNLEMSDQLTDRMSDRMVFVALAAPNISKHT